MNTVIMIPSLNPDELLVGYVDRLVDYGFDKVIVINDGSADSYDSFFEQCAAHPECTVLRHEVNRGKGAALKTGMTYYMEHFKGCSGIVTGDADGQHTLEDTAKLAKMLEDGAEGLILGSRDFSGEDVPARSRFGNRTTSAVFKLTHGVWLGDTQTGLRAIPDRLVPLFSRIDGERYEYEMNMLIECADRGIPITEETISTIYLNENTGSHFHAVRDSARIYWLILRGIIKYLLCSLFCFGADILLFHLLDGGIQKLDRGGMGETAWMYLTTFGASGIARICSSILNFTLNKKLVFKKQGGTAGSLWKYAVLAVCIYAISSFTVTQLRMVMDGTAATLIKLCVDTLLMLVSFTAQRLWVFKKKEDDA